MRRRREEIQYPHLALTRGTHEAVKGETSPSREVADTPGPQVGTVLQSGLLRARSERVRWVELRLSQPKQRFNIFPFFLFFLIPKFNLNSNLNSNLVAQYLQIIFVQLEVLPFFPFLCYLPTLKYSN
jgi:hypothetical protein